MSSARMNNSPIQSPANVFFVLALVIVLTGSGVLVYLPGISGPFVFDDASNFLNNDLVRIQSLDHESLRAAAFSASPGPLKRPIAFLTFALNFYMGGGHENSVPFKTTNIAIHATNGLLIFFLLRATFLRLGPVSAFSAVPATFAKRPADWLAFFIALLWTVHPINLTSVLYVVQRMTSLATMFMLLGILCYVIGRPRLAESRAGGGVLLTLGVLGFMVLGLLSKETAILLPLFLLLFELLIFRNSAPWPKWRTLSVVRRRLVLVVGITAVTLAALASIWYAIPGYSVRNFTLIERLMTEARVIVFYLSLILIPRLNDFGLHHDDIPVSTGLFQPWTTIPSILVLVGMLALARASLRRHALVTFGILWFFVGHLLESTILPLEIAHEHRNYLASLGIIIACVYAALFLAERLSSRLFMVLIPISVIVLSTTTLFRSYQWADFTRLAIYEVAHHPNSASAHSNHAVALVQLRLFDDAAMALERAGKIEPKNTLHWINMHTVAVAAGKEIPQAVQEVTLNLLRRDGIEGTTYRALDNISTCILTHCSGMQPHIERWMLVLLQRPEPRGDVASYYYFLGRALLGQNRLDEAMAAFVASKQRDPIYMHPMIEIVRLHLSMGRISEAGLALDEARQRNLRSPYRHDRELQSLQVLIDTIRQDAKNANTRTDVQKHTNQHDTKDQQLVPI
jgi:tetratricopeptide (TPR) repeat protein